MSGRIYCGTSGWNYKHWKGIYYPEALPQSRWLRYYGSDFDTVEINNSFYRLPERQTFQVWYDQAPSGFTFAVKASRYLTHMKKLTEPAEPLERMLSRSSALAEKHGPILYQLPPGWRANQERLESFLEVLPANMRHVFEFRDSSWQSEQVFDLLRRYKMGYCIMSAPDLPCHIISTADYSYIRMHSGGYETEGWYTDDRLDWWSGHIHRLLDNGDVYVYFNNDYKGFAIENAKSLLKRI
ncbi:MAG: DUF72 domain-containing protein [Armatimonadota bacterium]